MDIVITTQKSMEHNTGKYNLYAKSGKIIFDMGNLMLTQTAPNLFLKHCQQFAGEYRKQEIGFIMERE